MDENQQITMGKQAGFVHTMLAAGKTQDQTVELYKEYEKQAAHRAQGLADARDGILKEVAAEPAAA